MPESVDKLKWSIRNGDIEELSNFLNGSNADQLLPESEGSALVIAADYGQLDVVEVLIRNGADVNKADKNGITALLAAIWESHTKTVKYLLEKGACKDKQSPGGKSYEEEAEKEEIRKLLKNY